MAHITRGGCPGDTYFLRRALQKFATPCELHTIKDGEAAVTYLNSCKTEPSTRPDLVLLDINLPLVYGDEVLRMKCSGGSATTTN